MLVGLIHLASIWNAKASQWVLGRKRWKSKIPLKPEGARRYWFHVSSLGEFEQARPVIELLKLRDESTDIVLTFFSPSGYEIRKYYPQAHVLYLPADLPGNAGSFIQLLEPDVIVFVKYDLWPGYIREIINRRLPVILISAIFDNSKKLSSGINPLISPFIPSFNKIFLQKQSGPGFPQDNMTVAGDTRIDRVVQLPGEALARIPEFLSHGKIFDLIAGSTWPADEKIIFENLGVIKGKVLLAPHDVSEENLIRIEKECPATVIRYQKFIEEREDAKVILMDGVGHLQFLYGTGRIAYIGGGFGKGIHNTLEPMAFGIPVIFGPKYNRFIEAVEQIKNGGAFSVQTANEFKEIWNELEDVSTYKEASASNSKYIYAHSGATSMVVDYLMKV